MKAMLRPGFVFAGGTWPICPSPNLAALGGFRKSLRCASYVVGLVGCMMTFEVEER